MKRYLAIGAAVLVLAAAGWGLFWWSGRGEIERTLESGVARLHERGWTLSWGERNISGFPFGYSVQLSDVSVSDSGGGLALRLPWAVAETDGTERIVVRMPDTFVATLPMPQPPPAGDAAPPAVLETAGEADDLVLVLTADGTVEVTAERLAWTIDAPELGRKVKQTVEGLEATTVPDAPGARYRIRAARIGTEASLAEGDGEPSTAIVTLREVAVEGATTIGSSRALGEMLYAGAPGQAEGSLSTGESSVRVVSAGGTPGTLDWRAEAMSGRAALGSGRIELTGETRGNVWTLTSPDPALPVQGQLSVALAKAAYAMPMAPAERPDEMAISLALRDATADERAWAALDPQGVLPREPASLLVDLTGTARVTQRIDRLRPGAPPPFEISSLVFREVAAKGLGATANATGELEILQPIGLPLGEVRVGITGLEALIGALGRAGVLTPEMVMTAEAIMAVYLRPAQGEDIWTAEIAFTREGPLVNGLPVR